MIDPEFSLAGAFRARTFDEWREQALVDLRGEPFEKLIARTYEEIDLQPLFVRPPSFSDRQAELPSVGIDLRMEIAHPDLQVAREQIREDLQGGADSLLLRLDCDGIQGDGIRIEGEDDFAELLSDVDLESTAIAFDCRRFLDLSQSLHWFRDIVANRSCDRERVCLSVGYDPLGGYAYLETPCQPPPPEEPLPFWEKAGVLFDNCVEAFWPTGVYERRSLNKSIAETVGVYFPLSTAAMVNSHPYHRAGANTVQELAIALATGAAYLKEMVEAGMNATEASRQIEFALCVTEDIHLSVAKLRAARRLWRRVLDLCGATCSPMRLHARASTRRFADREIRLNLLRNTASCFAAIVGGADSVTPMTYDSRIPNSLPDSRRLARNTVLILARETGLASAEARAASSWFLDDYAERLARSAWSFFQEIEKRGGMFGVGHNEWLADQIAAAHRAQAEDVASGEMTILGVNAFRHDDETVVEGDAATEERELLFPDRPLAAEVNLR